jgi:NH(3)-dependent NAD(+) synthetase (EC 6.3.1.5)
MPDSITPKSNVDDAIETAKNFGIEYEIIDIEKILEDFGPFKSDLARANTKARIRMVLLYKKANEESSLVAGAGNKSEILTGYFTKYGDGACDILPIGDLYKTEVKYLAKALDIPKKIIDKVPSADLYEGQSDEKELGVDYATLDEMLRGFELQMKKKKFQEIWAYPLKRLKN